MRIRFALHFAWLATVLGCGEGVGRPIVERRSETPSAGASVGGGGWSGVAQGGGRDGFPGIGGRGVPPGAGGRSGGPPTEGYCSDVAVWPAASEASEQALFEFLNFARQIGISCTTGEAGVTGAPVVLVPELKCAARLHARDMALRGFFDHVNPDGVGPEDRIRRTGFSSFRVAGESLARGEDPDAGMVPYEAFLALFSGGGSECQNLVDPRFDSVGIGRYDDLWTLDFTGP